MAERLTLSTEGDRAVVVVRRFAAPPEQVFKAHVEADLLPQWLLGPEGWAMPVCRSDPRPGGDIRYEWVDERGGGFHLTGEFVAVEPNVRTVHVERMHLPDPTPDNRVETVFEPQGTGTVVTVRMELPDEATREAMLGSGMEHGMEASYSRLDRLLEEGL